MLGDLRSRRVCALLAFFFLATASPPVWAQFGAEPWADDDVSADAVPNSGGLQREYSRLAQLLNSTDTFGRREAAEKLLRVRPGDVANPDTRKLIARGYRSLALEGSSLEQDDAIRGLVIWGGRYSVPILIELMDKEKVKVSEELFVALGQLKDPRGAEAVAGHLGNFFNHDAAVNSLRRMGSAAEDALIQAAPSNDPKISLAAVQLLGEVGSEKSVKLLQRAMTSRNPQIKQGAREASRRVRERQQSGKSVDDPGEDPNSPFADSAGPPVDITERNSTSFESRIAWDRERGGLGTGRDAAPADDLADDSEGDWSQVHALLPGDPAGKGVAADPAPPLPETRPKPQPVRLGNLTGRTERPKALAIGGGARAATAYVVYSDPFNDSVSRLETVDLTRRRSLGSATIAGGVTNCVVSPGGTRLLLISQEGFHQRRARLDVLDVRNGKPSEKARWWPYGSGDLWQNDITWAAFVDEEQFFTLNHQGMLVLWRLAEGGPVAIYQLDVEGRSVPTLSGGRAYLSIPTQRGVEIFRAADGELLARMSGFRPSFGSLAFNDAGTRLACVSGTTVCIWTIADGQVERDFDCAALGRSGMLTWLGEDHLLISGSDVVDVPRRLVAWRYESQHDLTQFFGGWQWMVMRSGNVHGLVPAELLQEEVQTAADGLEPDALLALKPGARVKLEINLSGDDRTKAEAALRAALDQNGLEAADDAPLRLTAQVVSGRTETEHYGRTFFGRAENVEQVTLTERIYEVKLFVDGQSAWKQSTLMQSARTPMHLRLREGETAQQVVDRENAQRGAGFAFSVALPRYVVHPKYAGPLGKSTLSLGGSR